MCVRAAEGRVQWASLLRDLPRLSMTRVTHHTASKGTRKQVCRVSKKLCQVEKKVTVLRNENVAYLRKILILKTVG